MSETELFVQHPDDVATRTLQLGERVAQDAVVVGSGAVYAALNKEVRLPNDIDLVVSEDAYRYLRERPDMEESSFPDGRSRLTGSGFDVGIGWGEGLSQQALRERSWQSVGGVAIAGLPDVYAWKQNRNLASDQEDTARIRFLMQSPEYGPLPLHIMPSELEIVRACLPAHLHDDPIAPHLVTGPVHT